MLSLIGSTRLIISNARAQQAQLPQQAQQRNQSMQRKATKSIRSIIMCPMNEVDSENYFKESDNIRIDIYNRDKIKDIRNSNANTTISNIFKSQFRKLLS